MRLIRGLVPLTAVALLGAGTLTRPPLLAASDPPWIPPPCPEAARSADPAAGAAWYRLEAVLDAGGTLAGQRLTVGTSRGPSRVIELPPESFATGPRDGLVLVGADDGTRSRLSLVDPARACAVVLADDGAVVRSALVTADATAVLEHRVERGSRDDLGVWRRPLDGRRATRELAPLPDDPRYGRTFTTELRVAPDGTLAVSSCGVRSCRTRLVPPAGSPVTTVGPTGEVLGVTADGAVVAYAMCGGYPCPIVRRDGSGGLRMLVPDAGPASMAGDRIVFEAGRDALHVLDIPEMETTVVTAASGLLPVRGGSLARAGIEHRDDEVVLVPPGPLDPAGAMVLGPDAAATKEVAR